jgi:hypothetical protein
VTVNVNLTIQSAPSPPTVTGLSVLGSNAVTVGQTAQYTARATYSDGSTADLTTGPTWSSSNTSLATITQAGVLTAVASGSVTVQAVYGGRTATLPVTLNAASSKSLLGVSISGPGSVTVGQTAQYVLHATYTDGSSQNVNATSWWILESTATIAQTGVVTGVSAGTAIIHAYYTEAGVTRTAENLTISVVAPPKTLTGLSISGSTSVNVGQTAQYTAIATYSDGTSQDLTTGPAWSTSNSSLATITQAGVLTAQAVGTVTVQAVYQTRTAQLSVSLVTPPSGSSVTIYVNPAGHDFQPGTASQPVRTIWVGVALASQANANGNDAVVSIAPGTYREAITIDALNTTRSITLQGAGTNTVLTGADDWSTGWTAQGDGTYARSWPYQWGTRSVPTGWESYWNWDGNGFKRNELLRSEMVYVNGSALRGVLTLAETAAAGTFYVDEPAGVLYMRLPANVALAGSLVEVGTRTSPLTIYGRNNVTLRNFTIARNRGGIQETMVNISTVQNLTLDGLQIRWAAYSGLSTAYSSGLQIYNSVFSDNGVNGIQSYQDVNVLMQDSEVARNNWRGWADEHKGFDAVAKWSETRDVTITGGQFVDNFGSGIWFDGDNHRVVVDHVFAARNKVRGIYMELNPGPITVRDSKLCENAYEGIANARTDNLTITNNQIFDNKFWQITGTGSPVPINLVDWQTGQTYTVYGKDMTLTYNVIRGKPLPAGQPLPNECYPGPSCGWLFWAPDDNIYSYLAPTITADNNQWYHTSTTQTYRVPTSKGNVVDFPTFRTLMSQNQPNEVHSTWSNSTALSCVP